MILFLYMLCFSQSETVKVNNYFSIVFYLSYPIDNLKKEYVIGMCILYC